MAERMPIFRLSRKAPETKPKAAPDAAENFSVEDILAEFKDL